MLLYNLQIQLNVFQETNLHDAEIVNFNISPKRRVINTAKSELGKVAKSIVETNIKNAREVIPQPLEKFIKYTNFGLICLTNGLVKLIRTDS